MNSEPSARIAAAQWRRFTARRGTVARHPGSERRVSTTSRTIALPAGNSPADFALLLVLAVFWDASYAFIRVAVATLPPVTLIAARTLIAGSLLAAWMAMRDLPMPRDPALWRRMAMQALCNSVVPFTLVAWAEQFVEAGLATILNSASPVLAFVGTWLITGHERVTPRKLFGVLAGLAGIGLIVGTSAWRGLGTDVLPQLAIVAASICYAGAAIYGRTFDALPPIVPAAGSMVLGAALLIPASLVIDRPWTLHPSIASLAALVALSVFSTAGAFVIYFRLLQTLGSVATTAQAYLRVPIGVALSMIVLGESPTTAAWAGLVCVVAGVAVLTMARLPLPTNPALRSERR